MISGRLISGLALGAVLGSTLTAIWLTRSQDEPVTATDIQIASRPDENQLLPTVRETRDDQIPTPDSADKRTDKLEQALHNGDYQHAVELFERIYREADERRVEHYRRLLIDYASRLLHSDQITACIELLTPYLDLFYKDSDALITLAQAYREANDLRAAIVAFQKAWSHEHRASVRRLIDGQLNWTTGLYVQQLQEQDDRQQTVELFNYLIEARPENPHHYLALAEAYLAMEQYDDAQFVLRHIEQDTTVGRQARELMRRTHDSL